MLLLFFHTLVKHGHIAPDYRLQNHIHTCLSHRDASTQMQRGSGGGVRLYENHPLLILGLRPKADPPPSGPQAGPIFYFFFFSLFFFGKSKFVEPQKSDVCPFRRVPSSGCTHRRHHMFLPWPSVWQARAALWRPTPWAFLWHSTRSPQKKTPGEVTSLAYFCLVLDISQLGMN